VLDEPTSQLDPQSAEDVLQALVRLNHDLGLTIVLAEHRLERVLSYADQIVAVGTGGAGVLAGPPEEVIARIDIAPPLVALARALGWSPLPLTVKAGLRHSRPLLARQQIPPRPAPAPGPQGQPFLQLQRVEVGYGARQVLRGTSLDVWPGEIVALLGRNGAGKTTLLKTLVGLARPQRGRAVVAGRDTARQTTADICRRLAYLPQDPNTLLFADTVREELQITLRNHRRAAREDQGPRATPGADDALLVPSLLDRLGIAEYASAYPRDLSAGERQRVALAAVSVTGPGGLLLDEPTRGLDYGAKRALAGLLRGWRSDGMAILLVTHDVEFAATVADRAALLSQGEVIASGPTVDVLGSSPLFAPQVARLFPGSGWLTVDDVLGAHVAAAQA
ncbi:MAG TPA: ATP-binding cassette domain-containing protein, partial [Roseiflexaceae bacterium]